MLKISSDKKEMLIYGIKGDRLNKFKDVASVFDYGIKIVEDNQIHCKVGAIMGEPGYKCQPEENDPFDIEFILFINIKNDDLYDFIAALKEVDLYFPNKALLTANNIDWTLKFLFKENKEEHEVMTLYGQLRRAYAVGKNILESGKGDENLEKSLQAAKDYMNPREFDFDELKSIYNNLAIAVNKNLG